MRFSDRRLVALCGGERAESVCFHGPSGDGLKGFFPECARLVVAEKAAGSLGGVQGATLTRAEAAARRRREYTLGRACAGEALSRLGVSARPVATDVDRAPVWPNGTVGSITHCDGFCAAVVAHSRDIPMIGLDAERPGGLSPEAARFVVHEDDQFCVSDRGNQDLDWLTLAFSAKEAFYKAYYMVARTFLDFYDVTVRFERNMLSQGAYSASIRNASRQEEYLAANLLGRWYADDTLILCCVFAARC